MVTRAYINDNDLIRRIVSIHGSPEDLQNVDLMILAGEKLTTALDITWR